MKVPIPESHTLIYIEPKVPGKISEGDYLHLRGFGEDHYRVVIDRTEHIITTRLAEKYPVGSNRRSLPIINRQHRYQFTGTHQIKLNEWIGEEQIVYPDPVLSVRVGAYSGPAIRIEGRE